MQTDTTRRVRVDKWLWAARFFRSRARAREAIDGGKVHVNGQRVKPGKELALDDMLQIRQGRDEITVLVRRLSDQRRGAPEARLLYEETADSIERRERRAAERRAAGTPPSTGGRPGKRDRRLIHRFRESHSRGDS